jgi:hypothetical protein
MNRKVAVTPAAIKSSVPNASIPGMPQMTAPRVLNVKINSNWLQATHQAFKT